MGTETARVVKLRFVFGEERPLDISGVKKNDIFIQMKSKFAKFLDPLNY